MHMHLWRLWPRVLAISVLAATLAAGLSCPVNAALTTESPEVKAAINRGIEYLAAKGNSDNRVGALALAGMSMLIYGEAADHPMVEKCASMIQEHLAKQESEIKNPPFDIYSTGLAIYFLIERDQCLLRQGKPTKHRTDVQSLLSYLYKVQKPHGGWGYPNLETGDTSMTQYGVLSSWKAIKAGFKVPDGAVERVALWLIRTQDPSGAYGYQGKVGAENKLVKQSKIKHSLTAAGLGSIYICGSLFGMHNKVEKEKDENLTPSMKEVKPKEENKKNPGAMVRTSINPQVVHATQGRGNQWFAQNFKVNAGQYNYYYFYAFERYMSFREYCEGQKDKAPQWYSDIAAYILENQREDGSWSGQCNTVPDTSFAVLFLLRSMQRVLEEERDYGEGVMLAGTGLPRDLSQAMIDADGKVVSRPRVGPAEALLAALDDPELTNIDDSVDLLKDLPEESIEDLMGKYGGAIRKLVANNSPKARLVIVKDVLGKTRNLDNVEVLLYALTDPVPEVAIAANEALGRIRRNSDAVSLPEKFTEEQRHLAFEQWKAWYLSIRPDAKLEWTEAK
ncbi:MAG: hypothetical protein JW959_10115 [Pirellulales bacterium]|nr:hypothetical protein [Pirellulales bacterium]